MFRTGTGWFVYGFGGYNVMLYAESINTNVPGGVLFLKNKKRRMNIKTVM
jgi:hypothetical protein